MLCRGPFFSSWRPQTGRNKDSRRRTCQRRPNLATFFVYRLSKRGKHFSPQKALVFQVWEQLFAWKTLMNVAAYEGILRSSASHFFNLSRLRQPPKLWKLCVLVGARWALRHLTFWDSPLPSTISCWRFSRSHGCHAPQIESEDLGRWWPHPWSRADNHH